MPIYEYRCDPCDHAFETLIRGQGDVAHCPKCGGIELAKQFSVPAAAHSGRGQESTLPVCRSDAPSFGCGGPGPCGSGMCGLD